VKILEIKVLRLSIVFVICASFFLTSSPPWAHAANVLTVSNLNDSGSGSLRDAIRSATSGDTITFQSGLSGTIVLTSQLNINKGLTIAGPGSGSLTISGNNQCRVFRINTGYKVPVTISGLTVANGKAVGNNGAGGYDGRGGGGGGGGGAGEGGGGVVVVGSSSDGGHLTIDGVVFTNNTAVGGLGGHGGNGWRTSGSGDAGNGGSSDLYRTPYTPPGAPRGYSPVDGEDSYYYSGAGGGKGGGQRDYGGKGGWGRYRGGDGGWGGNQSNKKFYSGWAGYGGRGGGGGSGMGGAICLTSGYLTVKNSTFTNNRAIGGAGGVGGTSNYQLISGGGWYFGGNGGNGGYAFGAAIFIGGNIEDGAYNVRDVKIIDSTFSGNSAIGGAGGVGGNQGINGNDGAASPVYTGHVDNSYPYDIYSNVMTGIKGLSSDKSQYINSNGYYTITPTPSNPNSPVWVSNFVNGYGSSHATINVQLIDADYHPISGNTVTLSAQSGSSVISPENVMTGDDGTATFTVTNARTEWVTYSAIDITTNVSLSRSVTVTFFNGLMAAPPPGVTVIMEGLVQLSGTTNLSDSTILDLNTGVQTASDTQITMGGISQDLGYYSGGNLNTVNLNVPQNVGEQAIQVQQGVRIQSPFPGENVTITNSGGSNDVSVSIPDETAILAGINWDGSLIPPRIVSPAGTAPAGFLIGSFVVEVGSPSGTILFDRPVILELKGVTGPIGYKPAGSNTWVKISRMAGGSYDDPVAPEFPKEAYISNGTDTRIITWHFTSFASLIATPQSTDDVNDDGGGCFITTVAYGS